MANSNDLNPTEERPYWKIGEPLVWATGASLVLIILIALVLILVIMFNGLGVFWPSNVAVLSLKDGTFVMGEEKEITAHPQTQENREKLKVGNRDLYKLDFRWVEEKEIVARSFPPNVIVLERLEYGNFYGYLKEIIAPGFEQTAPTWEKFQELLNTVKNRQKVFAPIKE